jgi:hypothetical protein
MIPPSAWYIELLDWPDGCMPVVFIGDERAIEVGKGYCQTWWRK